MTENNSFDASSFLTWLEQQDGPIKAELVEQGWPDFPWEYTTGVTGTFVDEQGEYFTGAEEYDGEVYMAYYKSDLRRAARKRMPID